MNKNNIKNIFKATMVSAIAVPAIGVAAHFMPGKGAFFLDDAKLSHRFETAYKLKSNPAHREYTSYESVPTGSYWYCEEDGMRRPLNADGDVITSAWIEPGYSYDTFYNTEKYAGTPGVIYPLHVLVALGAYARLRRKEDERKNMNGNIKTR